ncbi:hypothetical protein HaLaN_21346, partial [Haematococcus lacustris]
DYAFRFFSTRYAHDVLTWGGASKDLYQDLWLLPDTAPAA